MNAMLGQGPWSSRALTLSFLIFAIHAPLFCVSRGQPLLNPSWLLSLGKLARVVRSSGILRIARNMDVYGKFPPFENIDKKFKLKKKKLFIRLGFWSSLWHIWQVEPICSHRGLERWLPKWLCTSQLFARGGCWLKCLDLRWWFGVRSLRRGCKHKENVGTLWQKEMTAWRWEEKEKLLPDLFLWK